MEAIGLILISHSTNDLILWIHARTLSFEMKLHKPLADLQMEENNYFWYETSHSSNQWPIMNPKILVKSLYSYPKSLYSYPKKFSILFANPSSLPNYCIPNPS